MPRGPEWHIQRNLRTYLRERGWCVEITHGNVYQKGIPDIFTGHPKYGCRWIDVKVEGRYSFTKAQRLKWPVWAEYGIGVWILTGADQENYDKLFAPPNWRSYWKKSWDLPDIDQLLCGLDELEEEIERRAEFEGI